MYTIVHSAAHLHCVRPAVAIGGYQKGVLFKAKNALIYNGEHLERGEKTLEITPVRGEFKDASSLFQLMTKYDDIAATYDIRTLLSHASELIKGKHTCPYYGDSGLLSAHMKELKLCAVSVIHGNGTVDGERRHVARGFSSDEWISEREIAMAKIGISQTKKIQDKLQGMVGSQPAALTKLPEFVKKACEELLAAAAHHIANVPNVCNTFSTLRYDKPRSPPISDLMIQQRLERLMSSVLVEPVDAGMRDFAHMLLWPRFGERSAGDADDEPEEDSAPTDASNLSCGFSVRIENTRYQLKLTTSPSLKFTSASKFHSDPNGITHLDVINRARNLTVRTIRTALIAAAEREEQNPESVPGEVNERVNHVLREAIKMEMKVMSPTHKFESTKGHGACCFSPIQGKSRNMYRSYLAGTSVSDFLRFDSYWACPFFVGTFLKNLNHPRYFHPLVPEAEKYVKMRDKCAHSIHLFEGRREGKKGFSKVEVKQFIVNVVAFAESVCRCMGISANGIPTYNALLELRQNLPSYFRWRNRCHRAGIMDKQTRDEKLQSCLTSLVSHCNSSLQRLAPVDMRGQLEEDSHESLRAVLGLLRERHASRMSTLNPTVPIATHNRFYFGPDSESDDEN